MDATPESHPTRADPPEAPRLPGLPRRSLDVFVAPGRLFAALRHRPAWAGALLLGAALVLASTAAIPPDVWESFTREQLASRGQAMPEGFDFGAAQRVFGMVGGVVGWLLFAFTVAGLVTFVFAFVLGDEGTYRQYLAVVTHAFLIPAVGAVLVTPLKIAQADPSLTLNLSLFAVGLDADLYPMRVLRMLDLFQLWSWVVVAVGAHEIDRRRDVGTASAVLLTFALALAMLFAIFL